MKNRIGAVLVLVGIFMNAQSLGETLDNIGKNIDVNFYLRTEYHQSETEKIANGIKLQEARMEVMGSVNPNLEYRVRFRMNRTVFAGTQNNAPSSLDHAYIKYSFGKNREWNTIIGKQISNLGSWEFYDNPTFEYQSSDFINVQQNLFPVAVQLSHEVNNRHSLHFQVYNSTNNTFNTLHENSGYSKENLVASKVPLGFNLSWRGKFFDNQFFTYYTLNTSSVAKGKNNFQFSLGNKWVFNKFSGYLDLSHSNTAVDYMNVISPSINDFQTSSNPIHTNVFAKDLVFQRVALRLNYAITPHWHIKGKTVFEKIDDKSSLNLGNNISKNNINLLAIEYQPFTDQNFKIFGYYANFNRKQNDKLQPYMPNAYNNLFSIGALWFLNAL